MKTKPFVQKDCPGELRKFESLEELRQVAFESGQRLRKIFGTEDNQMKTRNAPKSEE